MTGKLEVIIDGQWLSSLMSWGDLEWVTCWPGGTESITFGVARHHRIFRPDALVEVDYGGIRLAVGALVEPTRGEPLMAEGLHRKGEDYAALNSIGDVASGVNSAVELAVGRGLQWVWIAPGSGSIYDLGPGSGLELPALDHSQVHSIAQQLDAASLERNAQWGIETATRRPYYATWETTPTLHMLPVVDGLGISRDGYASVLWGRYLDSTDLTYKTRGWEDHTATERWGRVERTITEPLAEGAPITPGRADTILAGLLEQGRSQIGWTTPLEVQYGDVVTEHMAPVDQNRIHARQTIRLHGLDLDATDLSGRNTFDMRIARTRHQGATVTLEPVGLSQPMNDALAGVGA